MTEANVDLNEPLRKQSKYDGSLELDTAPNPTHCLTQAPYEAVYSWGLDGWDLGRAPECVYFLADAPGEYSLGCNIEGDWREEVYATQEARDAAVDREAFYEWKLNEEEWVAGIETAADMPAELRGRFSEARLAAKDLETGEGLGL